MENMLTLGDGEVVATINPGLAEKLHKAREFKKNERDTPYLVKESGFTRDLRDTESPDGEKHIKAGRSLLGFYGSIGEIDLFLPATSVVSLVGLVHIPKKTFPAIEFIAGEQKLKEFYRDFFKQTEGDGWKGLGWNVRALSSSFKSDEIARLPFIAQDGYNWKLEKVRNEVFEDGRPLEQQVADYERAVGSFISRLDNYMHALNPANADRPITPELARARFEDLERPNVKLVGF